MNLDQAMVGAQECANENRRPIALFRNVEAGNDHYDFGDADSIYTVWPGLKRDDVLAIYHPAPIGPGQEMGKPNGNN